MPVYDRNKGKVGAKKNLWISYTITEEQRVRFGLKTRTVREASPEDNDRVAKSLLAHRRREIREDIWRPASLGGAASGMTLAAYAESRMAERKKAGVKGLRNERQRLRDHVLPVLGDKPLAEVSRSDVRQWIDGFMRTPLESTGKPPAPRMVHLVYADLRALFVHAVEVEEILPASPCVLKVRREELPKKRDADPRWRASAIFERSEVEVLLGDDRIHPLRRMTYALMFLTGSRIGEVAGLLWGDYDTKPEPLGRIIIATTYGGETTKTETPRHVPVHPELARMLAEWKREFVVLFGRHPTPEDHVVPRLVSRKKSAHVFQDSRYVWRYLQRDLMRLGLRPRRVHDGRRTFITLARSDGANKDILDWITHGPDNADMQDLYTTFPWDVLCAQVSCLKITPRRMAEVTPLRPLDAANAPLSHTAHSASHFGGSHENR